MADRELIQQAMKAGFAEGVAEIVGLAGFERLVELARAAEREAIAEMVEDWDSDSADPRDIAAAIRARGQDPMPLFDDWDKDWQK